MKNNQNVSGTVSDFGYQWTLYQDNTGYYGSLKVLESLFGPLLTLDALQGKTVADVGAGTGRFTRMLHQAGARRILALEPSSAFDILKKNTSDIKEKIEYLQDTADNIPAQEFDMVFCIGVLQFIADPHAALESMQKSLKPGGKIFIWVYGRENNQAYLSMLYPIRWMVKNLSYEGLDRVCRFLEVPARIYAHAAKTLPLPLHDYMRNYFSKLDKEYRRLIIYDQLNPKITRYYKQNELRELLASAGFDNIQLYHRLGYSWSALATSSETP